MTKKGFLDKLKRSLSILKEEEREDILNEYKDIIEEKVKHGKTEEEAVKEFGNYDELVKGILDAYKINTDKEESSTKEKAKEFLNSGEELIKEGAKKLTEATDKLVTDIKESNTEFSLELVFELLLKGLCVLIIMALLTIPFTLFSRFGTGILDFAFFPLNHVLGVLWKLLIGVLYLVSFAFLVMALFKEYIKKPVAQPTKKKETVTKKEPVEKIEPEKKTMTEKTPDKVITTHRGGDTVSNLLLVLLKIFMIFVFIIPLWFLIIGLFIVLAVVIFFLLKGIGIIGILLGLIGVITFLMQFSNLLYNGIFNKTKIHVYPFLIAIVFMVVGAIMTIDYITDIEYVGDIPSQYLRKDQKEYTYTISKKTKIDLEDESYRFEMDPTLEDGKMILKVEYYNDFNKPSINAYDMGEFYYIDLNNHVYFNSKKSFDFFINNLKKNRIYTHDALYDFTIVIQVNETTKNYLEIE